MYYHDGVGTAGGLDRWTRGAFGEGIEANARELYRFILYNYELGDELYLFGFSRGAFTVRTLGGFMKMVGLVHKEDDIMSPTSITAMKTVKARARLNGPERFTT